MEDQELLSKETKLRIRMEEIYRNDVRKSLENKSEEITLQQSLWSFLNSTFGIWFLSTCVVGLASWLYSGYQEKERGKIEKEKLAEQREIERKQSEIERARKNASLVTVLLPYLASDEEKEWQLAIEVTKYLKTNGQLPEELEYALVGIVNTSDKTDSGIKVAKIAAAAEVMDLTNNSVKPMITEVTALPPRVYIQFSGEGQREIGVKVQSRLRANNFIAPPIENIYGKAHLPQKTEVRYYRDEEKQEALKLVEILKSMDLGLSVNEIPQKVKMAKNTRKRLYEIWLSKS